MWKTVVPMALWTICKSCSIWSWNFITKQKHKALKSSDRSLRSLDWLDSPNRFAFSNVTGRSFSEIVAYYPRHSRVAESQKYNLLGPQRGHIERRLSDGRRDGQARSQYTSVDDKYGWNYPGKTEIINPLGLIRIINQLENLESFTFVARPLRDFASAFSLLKSNIRILSLISMAIGLEDFVGMLVNNLAINELNLNDCQIQYDHKFAQRLRDMEQTKIEELTLIHN